ncbi:DUF4178 domain-containing protein [Roseovarius sp. A21]|uniref:DUF4178 domain-containing protein n=2 Tax=Roseovarius bejariae TaxID=2576383 RepID=A0A844CTU6_9RHOB|nr:DUF4178 domain-containing protein [Roseovarius bejariae]
MVNTTCPNCGNDAAPALESLRMTTCASCGTTLFIHDERMELAGEQGVMHEASMLFGLGDRVILPRGHFTALGHARYSYGRGVWDEFWGLDEEDMPCWLSVDEGDLVLQYALPTKRYPDVNRVPLLGHVFEWDYTRFTVSELDEASCVALRGSFQDVPEVGETYTFFNCTGDDMRLLSGEFWTGGQAWYIGHWHDPFEVRVERAA